MTANDFLEGQIILIDKPLHWSSFQAVNKIKWAILKRFRLKKIRIGHAGTLDPLATGLLILCTGKFTKKIPEIQADIKTYTGVFTLGATTPSFDMETPINAYFPTEHISEEFLQSVKNQFVGKIIQTPPVFSAVKKNGKRLYEFAREGKEVEVPSREVFIHNFEVDFAHFPEIFFRVVCSKGTYIRSLADDFGRALHSGAYLSRLHREEIGDFSVKNALSPDEFIKKYIEK